MVQSLGLKMFGLSQITKLLLCTFVLMGFAGCEKNEIPDRTFEIFKGSRPRSVFPDGVSLVFYQAYKIGPSACFSCLQYSGDLVDSGVLSCREVWLEPKSEYLLDFSEVPKSLLIEPTLYCRDPLVQEFWQGFDAGRQYYLYLSSHDRDLLFIAIDQKKRLVFSCKWSGPPFALVDEIRSNEKGQGSKKSATKQEKS